MSELLQQLPILSLRSLVLFPGGVLPLNVGREKTVRAIRQALDHGGYVGVVTQKTADVEDPKTSDLFDVGTVARITRFVFDDADSDYHLTLQGERCFRIQRWLHTDPFFAAQAELLSEAPPSSKEAAQLSSTAARLKQAFKEMILRDREIPAESVGSALASVESITEPGALADLSIANTSLPVDKKMSVLTAGPPLERAQLALFLLEKHVASMPPADHERLAQARRPLQLAWRQVVDTARERVLAAVVRLAQSIRQTGKEVLLEEAIQSANGTLQTSGKLGLPRRVDVLIMVGPGVSPMEVRVGRVGNERVEFTWHATLPVALAGFSWDACAVRVRGGSKGTAAGARDWFLRWFDSANEKQKDARGLRGVVHSLDMTDEGSKVAFRADFGSAPIEAFEDLLGVLRQAGATSVEFSGEAADPTADPG